MLCLDYKSRCSNWRWPPSYHHEDACDNALIVASQMTHRKITWSYAHPYYLDFRFFLINKCWGPKSKPENNSTHKTLEEFAQKFLSNPTD